MGKIKVIVKAPGEKGELREIDNTLEAFQEAVGGYIQPVCCDGLDGVVIICNEEGKLKNLEPNMTFSGDVLVGTLVFCGVDGEEFADVPDVFAKAYFEA